MLFNNKCLFFIIYFKLMRNTFRFFKHLKLKSLQKRATQCNYILKNHSFTTCWPNLLRYGPTLPACHSWHCVPASAMKNIGTLSASVTCAYCYSCQMMVLGEYYIDESFCHDLIVPIIDNAPWWCSERLLDLSLADSPIIKQDWDASRNVFTCPCSNLLRGAKHYRVLIRAACTCTLGTF